MNSLYRSLFLCLVPLLGACGAGDAEDRQEPKWQVTFFDDFGNFDRDNWQDQLL